MKKPVSKFLEGIKDLKLNVSLAPYTTLKIGGKVNFFCEARIIEELVKDIAKANNCSVPYYILGGGSNLLVSDEGFQGLVIHNKITGVEIHGNHVEAKSGTPLAYLILQAQKSGLGGLENLSGIPGTVGGAIFGNAGAYGQAIGDKVNKVLVFDGEKQKWIKKDHCGFGYRDSFFKKTKLSILEVDLSLKETLEDELKKKSAEITSARYFKYKKARKTAGSFFKNVLIKDLTPEILKEIPGSQIRNGGVAAAYFLEKVGAKGMRIGDIEVSSWHANLFINTGFGKASDFYNLALFLKTEVKQKLGVTLEPEVQLLGFNKTL